MKLDIQLLLFSFTCREAFECFRHKAKKTGAMSRIVVVGDSIMQGLFIQLYQFLTKDGPEQKDYIIYQNRHSEKHYTDIENCLKLVSETKCKFCRAQMVLKEMSEYWIEPG